MSVKKLSCLEKPVLFLVSMVLITLMLSVPMLSPLLFVVFPSVFKLIHGEKIGKQIGILFSLMFSICLIVFSNAFFIQNQFLLFLLASLYFTLLLGSDLCIIFYASTHK